MNVIIDNTWPGVNSPEFYDDDLIAKLELRWGEGFMSPGGAAEIAEMLRGMDLSGCEVLDFGCGLGGVDVVLVRQHDAAHVTGIDIEPGVIRRAQERAAREELGRRLKFAMVPPGVFVFHDASFDVVFSKDSVVHLPDKPAVFHYFLRVLRPGGRLVISDWFRGEAPYTEEMRRWATEGEETFEMDTLAGAARYATDAGFRDVETVDRNDWFQAYAADEYQRIKGPLWPQFVQRFGEDAAARSLENARIRALLARQGQLRPGHIRAVKPA